MGFFWKKPIFWIVLLLLVSIPLFVYYFKPQISSTLTNISKMIKNQQVPKPGKCLILEEKYCSQGKLVNTKNQLGQPVTYIGFRLPVNVPVFADRRGQVLKATQNQSDIKGAMAIIVDPNSNTAPQSGFMGDLQFPNMLSLNVSKGDFIAYTQDTGIKNFRDYNVIFTIRQIETTNKQILTDKQLLHELFPSIKQ